MKLHTALLVAIAAAPNLGAAAILDVSIQTTGVVHTGDTLAFEIFDFGFRSSAAGLGLSGDPLQVSFALMTLPLAGKAAFSGEISSTDGSIAMASGPLSFTGGWFSGADYVGAVSVLQGSWQLSPVASQQLFGGGSALLRLRNDGPDVILGLEPYTLRQDLLVSLAAGPLSVGATIGSVQLEPAVRMFSLQAFSGVPNLEPFSAAPEPDSSLLFLGGGVLLCGLSMALNRFSHSRQRAD